MAKRILITDDALFMRVTLKNILVQNGYEIVGEACNGAEAIQMYKSLKPDLVTMDITMPELDGLSALKEIRSIDPAANVVMCTAMGQSKMVAEALGSGAKDFIIKPFQAETVVEAIGKALAA
ncbi:MAG: response regulator [Armatimonadetes bacterium]|nr:response regulator [Armatimonadota bacterium]